MSVQCVRSRGFRFLTGFRSAAASRAYKHFTPTSRNRLIKLIIAWLWLWIASAPATAADLRVDLGHGEIRHGTADLLHRADVRTTSIPDDMVFRRSMHFRAVPLVALRTGLKVSGHLQFVATDGFVRPKA